MAKKTVLKLLISKYGALSTSLQEAVRADQAAVGEDDQYKYVDNDKDDKPEDNTDQTPKEPTEAEAPQDTNSPEKPDSSEDAGNPGKTEEQEEAEVVEPQKSGKEILQEKIAASKARREAEKNEGYFRLQDRDVFSVRCIFCDEEVKNPFHKM